jgi:chaperonin GroEL (HSP60 family)
LAESQKVSYTMTRPESKLTIAGVVKKATHAKVAVYTCGLDISQTETKGTVLLKKADELMDFTRGEEKQLEGVSLSSIIRRG